MSDTVSVIMPVYNCERFVVAAIRSMLLQEHADLEILVVDDGSSDGTLTRIRQEISDDRLKLITGGGNRGLPARLNQLIEIATGDYIARMDGDDISFPSRIARQLQFLRTNSAVDLVACSMVVIDNDNHLLGKNRFRGESHAELTSMPWRGFHMNHATWLSRRSFYERFAYDPAALFVEDEELLLRAYRHVNFAMLPNVEYAYRVDALNLRKILRTRRGYVDAVFRRAIADRLPSYLGVVPDQLLKSAFDAFVIGTGLERHLLKHRFGDLEDHERVAWAAALQAVEEFDNSMRGRAKRH